MVGRGDVTGASFAFNVKEHRWQERGGDLPLRELVDVDLTDVTITPNPAYPDTEVARRSLDSLGKPVFRLYTARALELMEMGL